MDIHQVLTKLGLQDKEPDIYLALLKSYGAQPASYIANKTDVNRSTTYKTLMKLCKKGLVTKTQRHGVTCFFAEDVDNRLEGLLEKNQKELEITKKNLLSLLPTLKALSPFETSLPKIRFYEGLEGVKRLYEDTLIEGETIYAFGDIVHFDENLKKWLDESYLPRRIQKKIYAYILTPENQENTKYKKKDLSALRETRFVNKNPFDIEVEINIYGNKVAFFSHKKEEMFSVILEGKSIAKSMKSIFDLCWKMSDH